MITKTNKKPEPVRALFPYLDSIASTKTKAESARAIFFIVLEKLDNDNKQLDGILSDEIAALYGLAMQYYEIEETTQEAINNAFDVYRELLGTMDNDAE